MTRRVAVFVDGSNFWQACLLAKVRPDYRKVLAYVERHGELVSPHYFTALPPQGVDAPLRQLTDWLGYNGWTVVSKPTKIIPGANADGSDKMKGNMDIEIVVQAFRMSEWITDLVLCSGDGDFKPMVEEMHNRGLRVHVISTMEVVGDELRRQCYSYTDLIDIADELRQDGNRDDTKPGLNFLRNHRS